MIDCLVLNEKTVVHLLTAVQPRATTCLCHHVVNEPVLVPNACLLVLGLVLSLIDLSKDHQEAAAGQGREVKAKRVVHTMDLGKIIRKPRRARKQGKMGYAQMDVSKDHQKAVPGQDRA